MEVWSDESVSGKVRSQLREARQLLMITHRQAPDDDAKVQSTVRLMEDLLVNQQLQSEGRSAFDIRS